MNNLVVEFRHTLLPSHLQHLNLSQQYSQQSITASSSETTSIASASITWATTLDSFALQSQALPKLQIQMKTKQKPYWKKITTKLRMIRRSLKTKNIEAMHKLLNTPHVVILDFVASSTNFFGVILNKYCSENSFTYYSEAHSSTSWIDHCLSSHSAQSLITGIEVLYYINKIFPLTITQ